MCLVEAARRVDRRVAFEFLQAEIQRAIEAAAQLVQPAQPVALQRCGAGMFQPVHMIAAHFADDLQLAAFADAGAVKIATGKFAANFICQCGALLRSNDVF